jgi:chemotaxis protein methyltransferase WspC
MPVAVTMAIAIRMPIGCCSNVHRQELQQLVEAVVVPETWFFRNAQAFDAMVQDVLLPKLRADPMAQVRLLSLPCSTGRAYTMAMA